MAEEHAENAERVWFITGSSRGLGRALAEAVLASGGKVVATARRKDAVADLALAHPGRVLALALDVTRADDAKAAIAAGIEAFGRIDVVVNNAGYANTDAIEDVDEDDFRAQMETNFYGAFHVTRAALPVLRNQGAGHVIQVSSIGGRRGSPGLSAYQSAKWALEGFSEVLLREVKPLGIHVTIVEPGGMPTDWAGASMRVGEPSAPYRATVGAFADHRKDATGRGDVAKCARAIVHVANVPEPPLRLLLGSDAVALAEHTARTRAAEDAAWRTLAMSTDRDGMMPFADTPVGRAFLGGAR